MGKNILITAAGGATGSFAVQLAKRAGFHVIGTCGADDKVELVKNLGCDRVIQYKRENMDDVLTREYPHGLDFVYEGIGGDIFDVCMKHLAVQGKMIIIGFISNYKLSPKDTKAPKINLNNLLFKSQSVSGYFLFNSLQDKKGTSEALQLLFKMWRNKELTIPVDRSVTFNGVSSVYDAIEYLHSGKNKGKVFVSFHQ